MIGVRSVPKEERKNVVSPSKPKKKKGNPSGSRHSAKADENTNLSSAGNKDPRLGSKKAIPLVVEAKAEPKKKKPKYFSPKQELEAIENDDRLSALLDKMEYDHSLTKEQQQYVDEQLARHKVLCNMLGIVEKHEEEEPQLQVDDPLARFDAIDPNKLN